MAPRSSSFLARVSVLLVVLVVVVAYAWHDVHSRRERTAWDHTLSIAVVVIRDGPVDGAAVDALRDRLPVLEDRLESELHRYRPSAPKPFSFTLFGPVDAARPAPVASGAGLVSLASHAWALHGWTGDVDARAGLVAGAYDSRIYVTAQPPTGRKHAIEGSSEQGGRIGTVTVDLDATMTDFALAVVAHELFHTLGATDHYDEAGHANVPDGLAEPDLAPRYPQRFVEVMTRGRPVSPGKEKILDTLDDLAVGPATAREVGWSE